ncbi:MAG: hypothetical protein U0271_40125 [Polyangiaceae bacterium]
MSFEESIARRFGEAHLPVEVARAPLGRASDSGIVEIDITRARRAPAERFRVYRGAPENRIEVLGTDRSLRQLVLLVHEPKRVFEQVISAYAAARSSAKVVRKRGRMAVIEQETSDKKRHFLCGMDESHLFVAELPRGVSSVSLARDALRAPEVPRNLQVRGGQVKRQGEWFFLPLETNALAELEARTAALQIVKRAGIAQAAGLRRAGRPHVAEEILVQDGLIYVRGRVAHPDHRTIELLEWTRVVPNRERFDQPEGVLWVD